MRLRVPFPDFLTAMFHDDHNNWIGSVEQNVMTIGMH
jgi:hypothetical protein